jgi:flagellar hook-basal body complex protein FliE
MQIGLEAAKAAASTLTGLNTTGTASGLTAAAGGESGKTPFSDLLTDAVGQVDTLETQAHDAVQGLMTGSGVDVHQAMIATQKASAAFELALAVRNKAVQAYQSVIGMQF